MHLLTRHHLRRAPAELGVVPAVKQNVTQMQRPVLVSPYFSSASSLLLRASSSLFSLTYLHPTRHATLATINSQVFTHGVRDCSITSSCEGQFSIITTETEREIQASTFTHTREHTHIHAAPLTAAAAEHGILRLCAADLEGRCEQQVCVHLTAACARGC